jgi:ATP-dependent helicase/nuclease subunit B
MQAGLQVQLPAYLAALCAVAKGSELLGSRAARPTGMFYVRLKDAGVRVSHRDAPESYDLKKAFEHTGRFSFDSLSLFDSDYQSGNSGQFSYRLKKDGELHGGSKEPVSQNALERLIKDAEEILRVMGNQIMDGNIAVDPYRKGVDLPCTWCAYKPVCRIDPWTHVYRPLTPLLAAPSD